MTPRAWACCAALLSAWATAMPPLATATGDETADLDGDLYLVQYTATAFATQEAGSLLWLLGPDGTLRVEVLSRGNRGAPPGDLEALLEQRGRGWTAVLGQHNGQTVNPWRQEWQRPPDFLRPLMEVVTQTLMVGPPTAHETNTAWRAGLNKGYLTSRPLNVAGPCFRDRQAHRGRGHGGTDDLARLAWRNRPGSGRPELWVSLSRRPGQVTLSLPAVYAVQFPYPETFVPLWPLSSLIKVDQPN